MYVKLNLDDVKILKHIFKRFDNVISISFSDNGDVKVVPEYQKPTGSFIYHFRLENGKIIENKVPWLWV